jgi:GNAT superfamily N-acetyltransferase
MSAIDLNSLSLIRYIPSEVELLHKIVAECGEDMERRYGLTHWVPPYPIETMRKNAKELYVYGIHNGNEIIGTFTVGTHGWKRDDQFWANPTHKPLYLGKLAIRPLYQGSGVGSWCLRRVEKIAHEWDCQAIRFDAIAQHTKLVLFYQNLGYLIRGTQCVMDWCNREWEIVYLEKVFAGD